MNKFVWFFLIMSFPAYSQVEVTLRPRYQQKISQAKTGHRQMLRFYKYYKKDSALQARAIDKKHKRELDSTWRAERTRQKLVKRLAKRGIPVPQLPQHDTLQSHLAHWRGVMKDTTLSDSARAVAKEKVKILAFERAKQYPGYQQLQERYLMYGDSVDWSQLSAQVPGLDTLKGVFDSSPKQVFDQSGKLTEQSLTKFGGGNAAGLTKNLNQFDKLKGMPGQYKDKVDAYRDPDKLKGEGKDKLSAVVADHFANHPEALVTGQAKVSKLLSKYRAFSNSNDLRDATKRTSMKGKTLFERLVIGGNFNVVSVKPVSLDLSPELGFRFSSKLSTGIGMNYRYTFGDTIRHSWYVSPRNTGFKVFMNYDIIKSFYAYGEWNITGVSVGKGEVAQKQWINNYFLGIGRKFLIHPKVYMTATAVYNLNAKHYNPSYINRFQIRIGFQLSEFATRKKQVYYDPNR